MDSDSKIFVAGHNGLVGSAIVRNLEAKGFTNIITMDRAKLDLTKLHDVQIFFAVEQPEYVFLAAAKVGGIGANAEYPADFIYENLMIQTNVISSAAKHGVKKLLFLGSSCIYPKFANQPITEDQLLGGHLESKGFTNIITMDRAKLDLTKLHDVQMFFAIEQPEYVFLAAAKVGGLSLIHI